MRILTLLKFSLGFVLLLIMKAQGQVRINEFCPSNVSVIVNNNNKYDDWLELYNAGGSAVNLEGYGLTDDSTKKFHFTFPSFTLPPGERVIVFTSDHNNQLIVNHWEEAVYPGQPWKYNIGSNSLDTNWRNISFNDATWSGGYAGIGFGDGDDNTTIPLCNSMMMRRTFNIPDTSNVLKAAFLMDYDDGFVAYLNGVEIARANLGQTGYRPLWNEFAKASTEPRGTRGLPLDSFYISPDLLKSAIRPGNNVLTIEVHNVSSTSDDMTSIPYLFFGMKSPGLTYVSLPGWFPTPPIDYFNAKFKLSHTGETVFLYNPSGIEVDKKTYPTLDPDHVFCRIPDGSSNWCYSETPTPETTNNSDNCYLGYTFAPIFSKQGGYYTGTQTISLTNSMPGGIIRYTVNGDVPTPSSPQYSSPISVSTSKSIRARVFATGYLPGPVITNTYIINGSTKLPTFSITTDSLNLWDYNTGIYVMGPNAAPTSPYKGANFWQDWKKPATIEYYSKSKNLISRFDANLRIYGNYSRAKPQKSFEIDLKDRYGVSSLNSVLIPDKSYIDNYSTIILRNSGTDWNKVHFRDAFMERMMKNTFSGYLATEPAIAYLNGEYWGVYNINEDHGSEWMKHNFGLDKNEIDYLKETGVTVDIQEGSDTSFWTLYNYATTQTATSQEYYDNIDKMLDLKNYADYFICETFYNNGDWIGDWTNNLQMWKPRKENAKWKYLLYDTDYGLGLKGSETDNRLEMARNPAAFSYSSEMFDALLKNPTFKRYFINRYCDLMNTIYVPANAGAVMHSYKDSMAYDMTAHFAKWGSSSTTWSTMINDMMSFESNRIAIMKGFIKSGFALQSTVTLTFKVNPNNAGRIEISTVAPTTYPWTGDYFNGNPVTIKAIPNPGFTFDHWKSGHVINTNNPNQSVTYNFNTTDAITAYFTGTAVAPKICVSEFNYNSDSAYDAGDWVELHNYGTTALNISGWSLSDGMDNHKFKFPTGTTIAANGYLVIVEDSNKFKSVFPTVTNRIGLTGFNFSNAGDQVRLFDYLDHLYLSFYYQDIAPWTTLPDGQGYTCELLSNTANPTNPASWFAGCFGGSPGRAYSTNTLVQVAATGSSTICNGHGFISATDIPGSTYQWKKNGTAISGAMDSVYYPNQAGSYSVNISTNGCSVISPPLVVSTVTQQPVPVTTSASRCGAGTLTLTATSSDSVFWYDAASAGNLVASGNSFVIPYLNQSKTYYAQTGRDCPSSSVATSATILQQASAPNATDVTLCGPGTATLNATDTATVRWYNLASGGALLATGNSFTTNYLQNDTSYFIEAGNVCPSPRIEVHVLINTSADPVVQDNSRCGNGPVVLTASSAAPVFWYDAAVGGNQVGSGQQFMTGYLSETDTFYAESNNGCPSARVMSIAIINPVPVDPILQDTSICPGSVFLQASATEQVYWFESSSGGNVIATGTNYTTPLLNTSTTYYVSTGYSCQSNRVPVTVTVNAIPIAPFSADQMRCDAGSVTLNTTSTETIYWYDAASGGNLLATGNSFATPILNSTQSFYVETGNLCRSPRTVVQAIIQPSATPPVLTDVSNCGPGAITLVAVASDPVNWFNVATGGSAIATGNSFTTPVLNANTIYYAEAGSNCISARMPVNISILPVPNPPTTIDNYRCGPGTVTLQATSSEQVYWYNASTGGILLGTGSTFTTPAINSNTSYYVETGDNCRSSRVEIHALIKNNQLSAVTAANKCGPGTLLLTATSTVSSDSIKWYDQPNGNILATGSLFHTPVISQTTTYYVSSSEYCTGSPMNTVAIIFPVPQITGWIDTLTIQSGQTITLDAGSGFINYHWSTAETTSQIQINSPGTYSVTVSNNYGCTSSNFVLVNMNTATIVNDFDDDASISVYPNPAKDILTIKVDNLKFFDNAQARSNKIAVKLFSTDGKMIYSEELTSFTGEFNRTISLKGIAAGLYYLQVESENARRVIKVVVAD